MISIVKKGVSLHSEARCKALCIDASINVGIVIEVNENVASSGNLCCASNQFRAVWPASYAAERKIQVHGSSFQLLLREKALFNAAFIKLAQTFLLFFSKAESEMFAVITATKLRIEFFSMAGVTPHARGYNLRD